MAQTRLTNDTRENIRTALINQRFADEYTALRAEFAAFALDVYNDVFNPSTRRKMEELPAGWLQKDDDIKINFDVPGERGYCQLNFNGTVSGLSSSIGTCPETVHRLFPHNKHGVCCKSYERGHALSIRYAALTERRIDLEATKDAAKTKLTAALWSLTTVEKLIEIWPDAEPFAAPFLAGKVPNLPSVPVAALNEILRLPVAAE